MLALTNKGHICMGKPFKGTTLPPTTEIHVEVVKCQEAGEPSVDLCKLFLQMAKFKFETQLRKNCDFFVMESHKDKIVHYMVEYGMKAYPHFKPPGNAYAFIITAMKGAFIRYVHLQIRG